MDKIIIRGARTHNLQNIDVEIPRDKLVVITGLSGSGKSSLAFDTLYAEGQRRYVESLSAYARQFLSVMEKPEVDHIEGLSPAISIEQKSTSHNPRSTVGTITEIYDYLRVLFARAGEPRCPTHQIPLQAKTISQMVDEILTLELDTKIMILAPVIQDRKGEHVQVLKNLQQQGFIRARINGDVYELDEPPELDLRKKHTIEVVVDRLKIAPSAATRIAESLSTGLQLANGIIKIAQIESSAEPWVFSAKFACTACGYSLKELEPRLFSFNSPLGACSACDGLGVCERVEMARVISDPEQTLAAGAIRGWDRRNPYYFHLLQALAKHYHFKMDVPFETLSKEVRDILLYGSGTEKITFSYTNDKGETTKRLQRFEGVIPNIERRYRETESFAIRDELSRYYAVQPCDVCEGARLNIEARSVYIDNMNLPALAQLSITEALQFFEKLNLSGQRGEVARKIQKECISRLSFLQNVGLNYLSLSRSAETLSGGEAQRIRLASQIGSGLVGVMYILDEPSIGLHQRDNEKLLATLTRLKNLGNTVIVVEHDEEAIRLADYVIDMGPGAGKNGGYVIATGTAENIIKNKNSITGDYLAGRKYIAVPPLREINAKQQYLKIIGASGNNLKSVDLKLPVGLFTCITGVSGSGKSTLINDTLYPLASRELMGATVITASPYQSVEGLEHFDKVINIDQSPIGRTPRSNPATYTGMLTDIRDLFSSTPEARSRGYTPGRFSFNVKGGRCEACEGDGLIKVEMHFLSDVYVTCDVCQGQRYNRETLEVRYKGKTIHEVLSLTVADAAEFFAAIPAVSRKCQTLLDVGLSYICLGQSATTLSGGEAQRIKLSKELSRRDTGKTLYILDEPTTGLHFHDVAQLLKVLHRLRDHGNTIAVIEHNLDVVKTADWIIDLGPEGGTGGGEIIAEGTPATVAKNPHSHTGKFLKRLLKNSVTEKSHPTTV